MKNTHRPDRRNGTPTCSATVENSYYLPRGPGLKSLSEDVFDEDVEIRFYYIDSVKWISAEARKPGLYQTGSGLNLVGRYATLCTCKRTMLKSIWQSFEKNQSLPLYVAALGDLKGRNPESRITPLVFLGKVERAFNSFEDIWHYLPRSVRDAKDVRFHALGDLYPPSLLKQFEDNGQIPVSKFAAGFVHAEGEYKKDLEESRPVVFKEWLAWPEATKGFTGADVASVDSGTRGKFKKMIAAPRQSASGWKYRLNDLRPVILSNLIPQQASGELKK